jgi:hypothetical protein
MSWVDIGREYMERARRAPAWKSVLYGIVHTNLMSVERDKEAVDRLLSLAPSPEAARRTCPIDPRALMGLGFYGAGTAAEAVCDKAVNPHVIPLFKGCRRKELMRMKLEQRRAKERGLDLVGLGWKGIDMTLLDSGCEVPVVDRHLARHLARVDPRAREHLGDPERAEEFEKRLRRIQGSENPAAYEALWSMARERAEAEGLPAGVWHVAIWMRERFAWNFPKLSEGERLEMARRYLEKLFT